MFKSSISSGLIIIFGTQYDFNAYFLAFFLGAQVPTSI
jgi:hypothetical protein